MIQEDKFSVVVKIGLILLLGFPLLLLAEIDFFVGIILLVVCLLLNGPVIYLQIKNRLKGRILRIINIIHLLSLAVLLFFGVLCLISSAVDEDLLIFLTVIIALFYYILIELTCNNRLKPKPVSKISLKSNIVYFLIKTGAALLLYYPIAFICFEHLSTVNDLFIKFYLLYFIVNFVAILFLKRTKVGFVAMCILSVIDLCFVIFSIVLFVQLMRMAFGNIGEAGFAFLLYSSYTDLFYFGVLALYLNFTGCLKFKKRLGD